MLKKLFFIAITLIASPALLYGADWELTLKASIPYANVEWDRASNRLIIGANQTATDGYDHLWDTPGLLGNPLRAYFFHGDYAVSQQYLWRDIRADHLPQEWDLWVLSSQAGVTVTLEWSGETVASLPTSLRIRLVDLDGGSQELDMRSTSIYTYVHADSTIPHHFRIIADEPVVPAPPADISPPSSTPPVDTTPGENPPQDSTPALNILTDLLPSGILGKPYKARLEAQGGTTPYHWKVVGGKLPIGLKLNTATGVISGKPRRLGQYRMMIQLVDANGLIVQKAFTLSIIHRGRPFK